LVQRPCAGLEKKEACPVLVVMSAWLASPYTVIQPLRFAPVTAQGNNNNNKLK